MSLNPVSYNKNMSLVNVMASMSQGFSPDKRIFYQIIKGGSLRGKDKLFDSLGYSYVQNYSSAKDGYCAWICSARNNAMSCNVTVRQDGYLFTRGEESHIHTPRPNEYINAIIHRFLKIKIEEGDAKDFSTVWPMVLDEFKIPTFYVNGAWYSQLERYFYKLKEDSMNLYFNSGTPQNQSMDHGVGLSYMNSLEETIGNSDGDPSILEFIMQITSHCSPASTLFDSGNSSMNSSSSCLSGSEMEHSAVVQDAYGATYATVDKDYGIDINQGDGNQSNDAYLLDIHKNRTVINEQLHLNKLSEESRKHEPNIVPSLLESENGNNSSYNMVVSKDSMNNAVLGSNCSGNLDDQYRSPFLIDCFKDIIAEEEDARYHANAALNQQNIHKPPNLLPDNSHLNFQMNNRQSVIFSQPNQPSLNNKWEHMDDASTHVTENINCPPDENKVMMAENMVRSDNCTMDNEIANFITEKESLGNTFDRENPIEAMEGCHDSSHSTMINENLRDVEEESGVVGERAASIGEKCPLSLINNILERDNCTNEEYNEVSDAHDEESSKESNEHSNEEMFNTVSKNVESGLQQENTLQPGITERENSLPNDTQKEDCYTPDNCKESPEVTESSFDDQQLNLCEAERETAFRIEKSDTCQEQDTKEETATIPDISGCHSQNASDEQEKGDREEEEGEEDEREEDANEETTATKENYESDEKELLEKADQDELAATTEKSESDEKESLEKGDQDELTEKADQDEVPATNEKSESEEKDLPEKEDTESPPATDTTTDTPPLPDDASCSTTAGKRKVDKNEEEMSGAKKSKLDSEACSDAVSEPTSEEAFASEQPSPNDFIIGEAFTINEEQLKELEDISDTEPAKTFKPMCTIPEDMKALIPDALEANSNGMSAAPSLSGEVEDEGESVLGGEEPLGGALLSSQPAPKKISSKKSKKAKARRTHFFNPVKRKKKYASEQCSSKASSIVSSATPVPPPPPAPRSLEVLPSFLQELASIDSSLVVLRDRVDEFGTKVRVSCITFHETVLDWAFSDTLLSSSFDNAKSLRTRYSLNSKLNLLFPEEVDYKDISGFHPVELGPTFPFSMPDAEPKKKEEEEGEKLDKLDLPFPLEQLSLLCPSSVGRRTASIGGKSKCLQTVPFADEPLEWAFKETFLSSFGDSPILSDLLGLSPSTKKWPDVAEEILSNEGVDHTFPFACPNSKKYLENLLLQELSFSLPPSLLHETLDIPVIPPDAERHLCSERDALVRLLAVASFYKHTSCVPTVRSNRKLSVSHAALVASFRPLIISQANNFAFTIKEARARLLKGLACQDKNIIPALVKGPMHSRRGCLFSNIQKLEAAVTKDPNNKLQYM